LQLISASIKAVCRKALQDVNRDSEHNPLPRISVKNYMSYKPQNEKAEIAFQSDGKILTALTRFE
jgi:hypothetical protein